MDIKEMLISIDRVTYMAHQDNGGLCVGCAFKHDADKCKVANSIISCSEENRIKTKIVWKPYSKETTAQEPTQSVKQDNIVSEIRELLLQRSQTGITKYGTTLDRKDLKPSEWCQHLLEELLDASGYVLRLKKDLEAIEQITKGSK